MKGDGVRLRQGRQYRIVATYDNPTGRMLHNGAMAHITGLFAPDNPADWPAITESDPEYQKAPASLAAPRRTEETPSGPAHAASKMCLLESFLAHILPHVLFHATFDSYYLSDS